MTSEIEMGISLCCLTLKRSKGNINSSNLMADLKDGSILLHQAGGNTPEVHWPAKHGEQVAKVTRRRTGVSPQLLCSHMSHGENGSPWLGIRRSLSFLPEMLTVVADSYPWLWEMRGAEEPGGLTNW